MDIKEIGNRINVARTLRNYTLDDIASEIGVAKSTIQRYEKGLITKPKLPVLQAIANSLHVNPAWLSGKNVPMENDSLVCKWNKETREYFNKTNAFEAELKSLGWTYEHFGCYWWYEYNELGLRPNNEGELTEDGTGKLIGCDDKKCINCNEREQYFLFTNGQVSFKVSPEDYDLFINDSQIFFKERLQQLLKKSMKQLFSEKDNQPLLNAAHTRTAISETDKTNKLWQLEEDIMDDPNF